MAAPIFKILRCPCGKQEYHSAPEKTPPPCPRCASPRAYSAKWYIRVWVDGKRRLEAISGNRKFAEKALEKAEADRFHQEYQPQQPTAPLLSVAIETVYQERWRQGKSGTQSLRRAELLIEYLGGDRTLDTIGPAELNKLHTALTSRGYGAVTGNRYLACLKTILRRFDLSTRGIVLAQEEARLKTYSVTEEQAILAHLDAGEYTGKRAAWADLPDLVRVLRDTGARLGEVLRLTAHDINLTTGAVHFAITKGGRPRTIYLIGDARDILPRRSKQDRLWHINPDQCQNAWEWVKTTLPLTDPHANLHAWRHTSCTRMIEAGIALPAVQKWHGHAAITTTMRYVHYLDSHMAETAEILNNINKQSTNNATI